MFPDKPVLERTSMNSWDDQKVRDALARPTAARRSWSPGLWTEVCNNTFALSAMLEGGYEIYMVADASGGTSKEAHDYAMQRMIQAGVVPVTWQQVLLEWQRDWARKETYDAVMAIVQRAFRRLRHGRRLRLHHGPQGAAAHVEGPRSAAAGGGVIRPRRMAEMRVYLLSLGAGLLVGIVYSLLNVRSPAPPVVALVGCSASS